MVADPNQPAQGDESRAVEVFQCAECGGAVEIPVRVAKMLPPIMAIGGKKRRRSFVCGQCLEGGRHGK